MGFMENFNRAFSGSRTKPEKTMAERYPSANPILLEFSKFKEGEISMEELSNGALILLYKETIKLFTIEVGKWNSLREKSFDDSKGNASPEEIKRQDDRTANTRENLNTIVTEMKKRGISENQPELKPDGIF